MVPGNGESGHDHADGAKHTDASTDAHQCIEAVFSFDRAWQRSASGSSLVASLVVSIVGRTEADSVGSGFPGIR